MERYMCPRPRCTRPSPRPWCTRPSPRPRCTRPSPRPRCTRPSLQPELLQFRPSQLYEHQAQKLENYLDLMDQILDTAESEMESQGAESAVENQGDKAVADKEERKVEQVKKTMTQVNVEENEHKMEITINFLGRNFSGEHLDVQVINGDVVTIKAEKDDKEKFERKFKLPSKCQLDKIESRFNTKDDDRQTLVITIPKDIKIVQ